MPLSSSKQMRLLFPLVLRLHLLLVLMYEEGGCVGLKAMALHAWSTSVAKRAEAGRTAVGRLKKVCVRAEREVSNQAAASQPDTSTF
jgi:hypothetical protein